MKEDLRQFNLGLASGLREHKTEQLLADTRSQEQQRHRQAPIDDCVAHRETAIHQHCDLDLSPPALEGLSLTAQLIAPASFLRPSGVNLAS